MAAVAEWWTGAVLASAEINGRCLGRFKFYRRNVGDLVAAVAEGLVGAEAAGTPVVAFAGFYRCEIRALLGNCWFGQRGISLWKHCNDYRRSNHGGLN